MKKERFGFLGMSVMALIFTVALFSLAVSPLAAQTELEGTWTHTRFDSGAATFTFSGNNFTYKSVGIVFFEGTFTTTTSRNTKTINLKCTNGGELTASYTIENGVLDIRKPTEKKWPKGLGYWYGQFKKPASQNNLDGTWKHPNPQAKGATFVFSGDNFIYTRNDGINISGTIQKYGNQLFLNVSDSIVFGYIFVFFEEDGGSTVNLFWFYGNSDIYYSGPFNKQ